MDQPSKQCNHQMHKWRPKCRNEWQNKSRDEHREDLGVIPSTEPSPASTYLGGPRDVTPIDKHIDEKQKNSNQMNEQTHKWMINQINNRNEQMSKCMHKQWTNKWMPTWTNTWEHEQTHAQISGHTINWMNEGITESMNEWMKEHMHKHIYDHTHGWMHGQPTNWNKEQTSKGNNACPLQWTN